MNPFVRLKKIKQNIGGNTIKILSNVAWAMGGKIVNMAGTLLVGILVARYLGPEQYGLMNYVISYVSIFSVLSTFGLDNIEIRELSRKPENKNIILGTCLRIRIVCSTMAFLVILVTLMIFEADRFTALMIICYSLTLYSNCFNLVRNYFTSIVKNEYVVKSEIARTIIGASIKIVLLLIKAPLEYFIIATLFDTFLVASGYCLSYKKTIGNISLWKYDKSIVPYFLKQSFPLVLSSAAVVIYQKIDQVMIGNMIDNESVGYFATAGKFLDLTLFLPTVLTQTITPLLVKVRETGTKEEYENKKKAFVSITVWISILLALFTSVCSHWLIYLTFGEKYSLAVPILQILAWKTIGMALSSSAGQIIIMEGLQKWAFIRNMLGCFICIGLNYILIPKYGTIGAAYVTIITLIFSGCLANILIPPYYNVFKIQLYSVVFGWKYLFRLNFK